MSEKIITANRLSDGAVLFLGPEGYWVEDVTAARVEADEDGHAALEAAGAEAVARQLLVEPYLIDVERSGDGAIRPTRYRERIRARGPSTHPHFGKQAGGKTANREAA
jgi:hypothetical protein